MHLLIFGHSFSELLALILLFLLAFYFLNKKQGSARRNAEDATGASGLITAPAVANSGGSSSSPVETKDSASCSSPTETDNGASSSSTASIGNCYEVFLSFRGPDTRDVFTSHLYKGLLNAGIHAFRDDDELPQGKSIGPELMAAITNSKIVIPVLSVTYGTSSWCLNELVRIMECQKNNEQMVLPIFYKVKPAEVGHQTGSFGEAFRERERRQLERPSFDPTILEIWKKALAEVSKLKGYEAYGDEAKLVESIVQKVLRELKKKFELVISENLVGLDSPMKEVMEFVNNKSHITLFVGIYGMGGIGKTTLAKAIYNKLFNQFKHHSFIADVRESSSRNGVHYLQKQLLRDILQQREIEVCNKDEGANLISSRCKGKRVIILLDDVDNVAQLKYLAGKRDWFSLGSIIIITTRNQKILEQFGVDMAYEQKEMNDVHSLILFSKHAFRRDSPPREFEDLARKLVSTTGRLPLSLQVLGSLLCGVKREFWIGTIDKLQEVPHKDVQETLMISYEALDDTQKQIFLDIACLFIGTDSRMASYMWEACHFFPMEGIEVLKYMSLIKIEDDHKLIMHDQLRDLGRMIVRKENQRPWHRSRLWNPEEALQVLKQNKGTDKIEAINLSKSRSKGFGKSIERDDDIYTEKQFKNLICLRFLNLEGAHLRGDFEDSMEELKWLRWPNCPMNFEVRNFHTKELTVLEMSHSAINGEWKGWSSFMMAEKLKFLDLSFCKSLESTEFLSAFTNLEVLILHYCEGLQRIDSSIGDMKALRRLDLGFCTGLKELPAEIGKLKALEQLLLSHTNALSALPDSIGSLENLQMLHISVSGIQEFPNSIGRLTKLRELIARNCGKLSWKMPGSMSNLSSLQRLEFRLCFKLQSLPELPSSLTDLSVTCQSHELPSLSHLTHLKVLQVDYCKFLKCIQTLPLELPESLNTPFELETLVVWSCNSIETLDVSQFVNLRTLSVRVCDILLEVRGLDKLIYLESLDVDRCAFKRLDLPNSGCLKTLDIRDCNDLVEIEGLDRLEFLESLKISDCTSIVRLLPPKSRSLKELHALSCKNLAMIQDIDRMEFLEDLHIKECTSIERLDLPKSGRLKILVAEDCKNLAEIQDLDRLELLEKLIISGGTSIERLDLPKSGSLKELYVGGCENLAKIEGLDTLGLSINKCTSIERLDLSKSRRLKYLGVEGCKNLVEIQDLDRLEFLERLNIYECTSIGRLLLPKSGSLKELYAGGCENLAKIEGLDTLELYIEECTSIKRLDLSKSGRMKALKAAGCKNLAEIQDLDRLVFLEVIHIEECTSIERLDLPKSGSLKGLYAGGCENLATIEGLDTLELHINKCTSIERLDLSKSGRMKKLKVEGCKNLAEIQDLDRLELLESLIISGCTSIERLLLPKSRSMKALGASFCKKLAMIQDIDGLEFLEVLHIEECTSIEGLDLPKSGSLKELYVVGCENLTKIEGLDMLEFLEKLHIDKCTSIERLNLPKSKWLEALDTRDCKDFVGSRGLSRLERLAHPEYGWEQFD